MTITSNSISLKLESQQEIKDLWTIVMFALDCDLSRWQEGNPFMAESEKKLAEGIVKKLKECFEH